MQMTNDETKELAARVIEKNKGLEGIVANPDFQDWMELVPKAELEYLKKRIVTIDRSHANWREKVCDMVIEYQGIHRALFELTDIRLASVKEARKQMKGAES